MGIFLDKTNIDYEIKKYINSLEDIKQKISSATENFNAYNFMKYIKRKPLNTGPYKNVSLFESSNRIFSDLIILFGIRQLLEEYSKQFPFSQYKAVLGNAHGMDITAKSGEYSFAGEAFNVAKSFFSTKKGRAKKSLLNSGDTHLLLIFNSDAIINHDGNLSQLHNKDNNNIYSLSIDLDKSIMETKLR